VTNYTVLDPQN